VQRQKIVNTQLRQKFNVSLCQNNSPDCAPQLNIPDIVSPGGSKTMTRPCNDNASESPKFRRLTDLQAC
jgi:hypothetical protein